MFLKLLGKLRGKWEMNEIGWEGIGVMGIVWVVWEVRGFGVFLENEWEWVENLREVDWGVDDDWFVGNI